MGLGFGALISFIRGGRVKRLRVRVVGKRDLLSLRRWGWVEYGVGVWVE